MDLKSFCTTPSYGTAGDPFKDIGTALSRHTLIDKQGLDPNTGNRLPFLPAGEDSVIRLGNARIGFEAEAVSYNFKVDPDSSLLLVKFAVVFEDPGHDPQYQPRFVIRIMDDKGELIHSCTEYDVSAGAGLEGFETFVGYGIPIMWRPWTTIAVDLSKYIGRDISVKFITYDCALYGHYGYAYYTARCTSNKLNMTACAGDVVALEAPKDCASYLWSTGDTTQTILTPVKNGSAYISCFITSVTGCSFTLNAYVTNQILPPGNKEFYDTICEGEPYFKNMYNLPPQSEIGTTTHINNLYDLTSCSGKARYVLYLTVVKHYYPIAASLCQGQDYNANGFSYQDLPPGILYDTLRYPRLGLCDSVVCLELLVAPSFEFPHAITGETHPCTGGIYSYSLPDVANLSLFNWQSPPGANLIQGQSTATVKLQYNETARDGKLAVYGLNGCGSGWLELDVFPKRAYYDAISDTICPGLSYNKNGFNLPKQDSVGYFLYTYKGKTHESCDSVKSLHLYVVEAPKLSIIASTQLVCANDTVKLRTMTQYSGYVPSGNAILPIAIGDILCGDASMVKPSDFIASGKTALGVVFFVDSTGKHGWATHLHDQSSTRVKWGAEKPPLGAVVAADYEAVDDFEGMVGTAAIRLVYDNTKCPPVWLVDMANGWYVPAAGQMSMLINYMDIVNPSLRLVNGSPFREIGEWYYYTTTYVRTSFGVQPYTWSVSGTQLHINSLSNGGFVRSIRNF